MNIENIKKDILELEGLLELYDWIYNYDKKRPPSRKNLFLLVKTKLNLNIIDKNLNLTPKSNTVRRKNINNKEFFSEKYERFKMNKHFSYDLLRANNEKKSRPSTYCSIYPISTLSRIHDAFLEASYKNDHISNLTPSEDENEKVNAYNNEKISQGNRSDEKLSTQDNSSVLDFSETEYDEDKYHKYQNDIDVRSLNYLMNYLDNILKAKMNKDFLEKKTEYLGLSSNFCFLSYWKKVEELTKYQFYEINEEIIIWQHLRDVLLLTGMSLKYPTWSGEQLTNIITRIIPKKILNIINNEQINNKTLDDEKNKGLLQLYHTFLNHSTTIFDLITVSKLVQEHLKYYVKLKKNTLENQKNNNEKNIELKLKNNEINCFDNLELEEISLDVMSGYNTCREFDFDEEGYASVSEIEDYKTLQKKRDSLEEGVKLIDSLGLFVDVDDIQRAIESDYSFKSINQETSQINELESNKTYFHDELEIYNVSSMEIIAEGILNFGISKKLIEEIINHSEMKTIEMETLKDVCKIIDNCIYNSNLILSTFNKNKVQKKNIFKKVFFLFFFLITIMLSFAQKYNYFNLEFNNKLIYDFLNDKIINKNITRILKQSNHEFSKYTNTKDDYMIKASDCILSKWENLQENNNICNAIGDITVIEKCFTNINSLKPN